MDVDARLAAAAGQLLAAGTPGELYVDVHVDGAAISTRWMSDGITPVWTVCEPGPWAVVADPDAGLTVWGPDTRLRVGEDTVRFAPLDMADPDMFDLPQIRDATLTVLTVLTDGPNGTVWMRHEFVDGNVVSARCGVGEPDVDAAVTATMAWSGYLSWRAGADILEVIAATGSVTGHWTELLLLHGLVQQPEWAAAIAAIPPTPPQVTAAVEARIR